MDYRHCGVSAFTLTDTLYKILNYGFYKICIFLFIYKKLAYRKKRTV